MDDKREHLTHPLARIMGVGRQQHHEKDPMVFLVKHKENVINCLKMEKAALKWYLSIQVQFKKEKHKKMVPAHFRGKYQLVIKPDSIETRFPDSVKNIHQSFTDYQRLCSQWVLDYS